MSKRSNRRDFLKRMALTGLGVLVADSALGQTPLSAIGAENALPGNPSTEWDVSGSGDPNIQGFATDMSINRGETIFFKINTPSTAYHLDIYRMGYYAGTGARKVATVVPSASLPQSQPNGSFDAATRLRDYGNWAVSAFWDVPANAVSGIYFAKLVRDDAASGGSHIVFIVRDDAGASDLLFQTSDTTWQAYNQYGGASLYDGEPGTRAYKVSYNRPFLTRASRPECWVFLSEYPMVRWLEANGYNVSYTTGVDSDRRGSLLLTHKVFLSVGHDEYWSAGQRRNVETARAAGVHLAFFSGNECFWKTRWESSMDGTSTSYRTLVCYKETHNSAKIDPLANIWTGTWRDARFSPPADGGQPENALTGTIFAVNAPVFSVMTVPSEDGKMRLWRNTPLASLPPGTSANLSAGTLGSEVDEDSDNGFRPAGMISHSTTVLSRIHILLDSGTNYLLGENGHPEATKTHHITMYRHGSGALVFGAGTIQWAWGLDSHHDIPSNGVPRATLTDSNMQQCMVNLFADMGAQPASLQSGLVPATASQDVLAPTSYITSPSANAMLTGNTVVNVTGTAADAGGGVVGGVDVSVDGGATWHPAVGRENWSFAWRVNGTGTHTIRSRAVDDSGNIELPSAGVTVTVRGESSLWNDWQVPGKLSIDSSVIEIGMRFRSASDGLVTGVRFYKSYLNTGAHTGHLWSNSGVLLASVTFTGETTAGWQTARFSSAVPITANTTYVVSYHTDTGNYAGDENYFAVAGYTSGPLTALKDGVDGRQGVYRFGASAFPNQTYMSSNYWVDVLFTVAIPAPPLDLAVTTGDSMALLTWTASSGATGYSVKRSTTAAGPYMLIANPTATTYSDTVGLVNGTQYYYVVSAVNAGGESVNSSEVLAMPHAIIVQVVPTLSSLSPSVVTAGGGQVTLTLTGSSFLTTSVVSLTNANNLVTNLATTYVSGTSLTASVPAGLIAVAGMPTITVVNPGNARSEGLTLTVQGTPRLVLSATATRSGGQTVITYTLTNAGTAAAANVTTTTSRMLGTGGTTINAPSGPLNLAAGASTPGTLTFPAGVSSGSHVLQLFGAINGAGFSLSLSVNVP